jgi:hypothetical protein
MFVCRGPNTSPLASFLHNQRPMSAMPWSFSNATSYLDKNFTPPWSPSANPLSPTVNSTKKISKTFRLF